MENLERQNVIVISLERNKVDKTPFLDFYEKQIIVFFYLRSVLPESSLHLFHSRNEPQLKSIFDKVIMLYIDGL